MHMYCFTLTSLYYVHLSHYPYTVHRKNLSAKNWQICELIANILRAKYFFLEICFS